MNITILTAGTRGDVQPYIALAQGLQRKGHSVTVATGTNFEEFVTEHGARFAPLNADYYQLMDSPEGQALKSGNPIRVMQNMKSTVFPLIRRLMDDSWQVVQGADALIFHPKMFNVPHLAEKLGIPAVIAATIPVLTPTRAFPAPGIVNRNLGGMLNKLTYGALNMITVPFKGIIEDWRETVLKLPRQSDVVQGFRMNGHALPTLYCYSPSVIPEPDDWDESAHATGYWFLDDESKWQPPADLEAFLAQGSAPVYVGFGSMIAEDTERLTQTVIAGLQQSGERGIIASGWGGLREGSLPPTIYQVKEAPHDWLFPRVKAVVHHGGAGTVAAGLRAGKPTIVCPFMADQPFWGNRIFELGVGPRPIPQKHLTAAKLAEVIGVVASSGSMAQRAADLGAKIRAENGVENAVNLLNQILAVPSPEFA
jgi:sterol 3beta-glucosyltransferase